VSQGFAAHPSGAYRYIAGGAAFSSGVAAEPGHSILGLVLRKPMRLEDGLRALETEVARRGLPLTSVAALQLRSPSVMSPQTFGEFNSAYVSLLDARGLLVDGVSPIARTNVVPVFGAPGEVAIFAAFLVVPEEGARGDFVVAGSAESVGGILPEHIVAYGDITPTGLRAKAEAVLDIMSERTGKVNTAGLAPTSVGVYSAYEIPGLEMLIASRMPSTEWLGFSFFLSRPPVSYLEFELDCMRVSNWAML
jgi:hypothetical protein